MAAGGINLSPDGGFSGEGPLGTGGEGSVGTFSNFLSSVVGLLTIIGAIWFVFLMITGAIGVMTSEGDKAKLESAKNKITYGIVGLVVIIASISVVILVGTLIGFPNILDLEALIDAIS